jgi:hypothetical protein
MNAASRRRVDHTGPLAWMTKNTVAANILMWVCLIGGVFGFMNMTKEVFPEFELDLVTISVAYPGASPEDVEQGIVLKRLFQALKALSKSTPLQTKVWPAWWWKLMNLKTRKQFMIASSKKLTASPPSPAMLKYPTYH